MSFVCPRSCSLEKEESSKRLNILKVLTFSANCVTLLSFIYFKIIYLLRNIFKCSRSIKQITRKASNNKPSNTQRPINVSQPTESVQKHHSTVTCSTKVTRNIVWFWTSCPNFYLILLFFISTELDKAMNSLKLAEISFKMLPNAHN